MGVLVTVLDGVTVKAGGAGLKIFPQAARNAAPRLARETLRKFSLHLNCPFIFCLFLLPVLQAFNTAA